MSCDDEFSTPVRKVISGSAENAKEVANTLPVISVDDLPNAQIQALHSFGAPASFSGFDGDKFFGGFGETKIFLTDYWTLRARSWQLFTENQSARGLIRRLLTFEINTGLILEADPNADLLGLDEDVLGDWAERTESLFDIWVNNPELCDVKGEKTFGQIQHDMRLMALVSGDVLVILREGPTRLPQIQLVDGSNVTTPISDVTMANGHTIVHGIELNARGKQVAAWVVENGIHKRVAFKGRRTGRKQAWLVYGTDRRLDEVRGQPILALVMQSLKDSDRYRDAELRAAVVNGLIAAFVKKSTPGAGSAPMSRSADSIVGVQSTAASPTPARSFKAAEMTGAGVWIEDLAEGEEPTSYNTQRPNVNYAAFDEAILGGIAWAMELPPEHLIMRFGNSYSASRQADSLFQIYLDKARAFYAISPFCKPIYKEWLISASLTRVVQAPRFIDAWRSNDFIAIGAWLGSDWGGAIKPHVDLAKEVRGLKMMIEEGLITRDRACKRLTNQKQSRVVKKLAKENAALAVAREPLEEKDTLSGAPANASANALGHRDLLAIAETVVEEMEANHD